MARKRLVVGRSQIRPPLDKKQKESLMVQIHLAADQVFPPRVHKAFERCLAQLDIKAQKALVIFAEVLERDAKAALAKSRSESRCMLDGKRCPDHLMVHGREAEQLRSGIEELIRKSAVRKSVASACTVSDSQLMSLLDRVDAGDSLAFAEILAARKRKRKSR